MKFGDFRRNFGQGRMVPIDRDTGGHQETVSSRQVQVQVPAPFELDGRVYEEKQVHFAIASLIHFGVI